MNRFANNVVAAKTERDVGDSAAYFRKRQISFDPTGGIDVVNRVVVVLLHAGGNREDIGIEDDVFRRKSDFIYQGSVSPFADADLVFISRGLTLFVKCHYNDCRTIFQNGRGVLAKSLFAFFQRYRIDDAFAL